MLEPDRSRAVGSVRALAEALPSGAESRDAAVRAALALLLLVLASGSLLVTARVSTGR